MEEKEIVVSVEKTSKNILIKVKDNGEIIHQYSIFNLVTLLKKRVGPRSFTN